MVIKLMKREFRDSSRSFIPVLVCILVGSILLPIQLNTFDESFIGGISAMILLVIFVSIFVLSIRASFHILYTNMYNQNGYELFTLPVKLWQIIVAKILTLILWFLSISIVTYIGMTLMVLVVGVSFKELFDGVSYFFSVISDGEMWGDILLVALHSTVTSLQFGLLIFFAGSVGNSSLFSKNRGWWTFLIVIVVSMILSIISTLLGMSSVSFFEVMFGANSTASDQSLSLFFNSGQVVISTLYELIIAGVLFAGTLWMWDNKLEIMN